MGKDAKLSSLEIAAVKHRRLEAMKMQELEGCPLRPQDVAMFEMFEREGWSFQKRETYLENWLTELASADSGK